mgnify:CR=1 FL=1|jgi:Ca2+:H+ antiporter
MLPESKEDETTEAEGTAKEDFSSPLRWPRLGLKIVVLDRPMLATLHLALPFAVLFMLSATDGDPASEARSFFACLLALIPLAELLGYATEQLAAHTSSVTAGLLNASLGNVPELVVTILCIVKRLDHVAVQTLVGGTLSNLLIVSGLSMFFGGVRHKVQAYNINNARALLYLTLLVAIFAFLMTLAERMEGPSFSSTAPVPRSRHAIEVIAGSHALAVGALVLYGAFLLYSMHTHKDLFDDDVEEGGGEDNDEEEEMLLGYKGALAWMAALVAIISWLSDGMVDAIDGAAVHIGMPSVLITVVVIPNVNNALEHLVAVMQAWKNNLDISIAVSVGSAAQLLVLMLPLAVVTDWIVHPSSASLTLSMPPLLAAVMLTSIGFATAVLSTGKSTWLHGLLLLACYAAATSAVCIMIDDPPDEYHVPLPPPSASAPPLHNTTSTGVSHMWQRVDQHQRTGMSLRRLMKGVLMTPAQ